MYSVVVAAMKRQVTLGETVHKDNNHQVVAVDADPRNLAYVRKSLEIGNNLENSRLLYNAIR